MLRLARIFAIATILGVVACGGHHSPAAPTPPPTTGGGTGDSGSGGTPSQPPPPPAPPTLKVTKILCFGDSLTEGIVQPPASLTTLDAGASVSYPYKLQTLETDRYTSQTITVWNAGHAGEAVEDSTTYPRFITALDDTHPDVLLLMEGDNDLGSYVSMNPSQNAGITAVVNAMEDLVRAAQARGVTVFVATVPPQRAGAQRGGNAALVAPYNAALKTMIARKGATLVDMNALFPLSLIGLDGLHPTEDGYEKMAEIFQSALAAVYEVPPSSLH